MTSVMKADRFDGDYYKPDDLEVIGLIDQNRGNPLASIATILTGRTPNDYDDSGSLLVVRSGDLVAPLIYPTCGRPFLKVHTSRDRVRLRRGDILISSIGMGSIGKISLVVDPTDLITVSEVTILRDAEISPEFLFAYLASSTGQAQIEREVTGATGQQHLLKSKVGRILVPSVPNGIESTLQDMLRCAHQQQEAGRAAYVEAEALLESALGLDKLDLTPRLFYERPYTDVQAAERFDAEYFQPKFDHLLSHIENTTQMVRLGDYLREPAHRGLQPLYVDDGEYRVINSQHIGSCSINLDDNRRTSEVLAQRNKGKSIVKRNDVLLNSTGYQTIGRAQALLEEVSAVVDSHVTILRPKPPLDPVYLAAFLNGLPGFLQTERHWTGSSGQIELRLGAIENYKVWLAPNEVQKDIRKNIEEANDAGSEARRLLDEAKAMVEKAILADG